MKRILFSIVCISLIPVGFAGADASDKNAQLLQAAKEGNLQNVQILLDKGANVNSKDNYGYPALYFAAQNGHTEIVKIMLKKGAEVNTKTIDGVTALWIAASNGHIEVVKSLLEKNAEVNNVKRSKIDNATALMQAALSGHTEIVKLLLEKGADVNAKTNDGVTALIMASQKGHIEIVKSLLEKGADINVKDNDGETAIEVARKNSHTDIAQMLEKAGATEYDSLVYNKNVQSVKSSAIAASDKSGKSRTFIAGKISIQRDLSKIENKAFIATLAQPLKENEELAAMTSADQAWSISKHTMQVGERQIDYPILAMVKCSDGMHTLFPAVLTFKIDIKAGETVHVDGFQIESKRAVKAGKSISVILVGLSSMISIETTQESANAGATANPWFTAHKDDLELSGRNAAIEAWQLVTEYVGVASGSDVNVKEKDNTGAAQPIEKASVKELLPFFKEELQGSNPVRVKNPNSFAVSAGIRSGQKGVNFDVPANGEQTVYVPDGKYDIYFVYSDKPDALFQGDSFTLSDNGIEIQIVQVVNGNYNIRQVKIEGNDPPSHYVLWRAGKKGRGMAGRSLLFSVFSQHIEEVLHIIGQGGFEADDFFGCGVLEGNNPCVEGAAGDNGSFEGRVGVF